MKEVKLAKSAGFCFGVKRAVDIVYKEAESGGGIYTYGPIIHNEEVVNDLKKKGVSVINSENELDKISDATVIIRAHGVPREIYSRLENNNVRIIDATCPFVKKIHRIVDKHSSDGETIVIIGNANHPEVMGIKSWCKGTSYVVSSKEDLDNLHFSDGEKCVL